MSEKEFKPGDHVDYHVGRGVWEQAVITRCCPNQRKFEAIKIGTGTTLYMDMMDEASIHLRPHIEGADDLLPIGG